MRKAKLKTIGENETSCLVYGMPKAAADLGALDLELPIEKISQFLNQS